MDEDLNRTGGGGPAADHFRLSGRAPFIVGAALVVGIGLYLVIHHSGSGALPSATRPSTSGVTVTTPTASGSTPPSGSVSQIRLVVINAAGTSPAAVTKITTLRRVGYPIVAVTAGASTTGTTVQCKPGLEKEATALAKNLGSGATVKPFPSPAPPIAGLLDCLVTIGK